MTAIMTSHSGVLRRGVALLGCTLVACLVSVSDVSGREQSGLKQKPIIVVPPFENQSKQHHSFIYEVTTTTGADADQTVRRFTVDRLTQAPRSVLENMLGNISGLTIVERKPVDALLVESEFGSLTALLEPDKAVKLGKKLGANLVVLGTIIDLHDDVVAFKGYGIRSENVKVLCQIRVRLLDVETGKVRFSKIVKGSQTYSRTNFGGKASSDRNFAAIEDALAKLEGDAQFEAALLGRKASSTEADGLVEVEFAPKPDNSDIEIDGKYVGGSPIKRRLPAGKDVKVRITKDGYKDWEGVIVPETGLKITRQLGPSR